MIFRKTVLVSALMGVTAFSSLPLVIHSERPLQAESSYEALEPFETPISGFFIRNHHDVPIVDFENHQISIHGLVENPIKITVKELRKLPQKNFYAVLECSGNKRGFQSPPAGGIQWSEGAVGNAEWEGVSLRSLLEKAKPKKEARFITVRGADKPALPMTPEFVRSIPISKALEPDTLLALKMNRQVLPLLHGGPVRLALPNWYGQNWIKWVTEIVLTAEEDQGFYMKKAYRMPRKALKKGESWNSEEGVPIQKLLVQSLLVKPRPESLVSQGKIILQGKAFSGDGEIAQVDISKDKGKTWQTAKLLPAHPLGGWREFEFETDALKPGRHEFLSRACDSKGNIQPLNHSWNPPGYLTNAVMGVSFWVLNPDEFGGYEVYQNQCLTCHTQGLISSQRFDKKGWKKLLSKMKTFGASISEEDESKLIRFLLALQKRAPKEKNISFYQDQKAKFESVPELSELPVETEKIYASNCAQCHGGEGEGKMGPRLRGRNVPYDIFKTAVLQGRNRMPAFGQSLNEKQVQDLWNFLQKPI